MGLVGGEKLRPVGAILRVDVEVEADGEAGKAGVEDVGAVRGGVHPRGNDGAGGDGGVAGGEVLASGAARAGDRAGGLPRGAIRAGVAVGFDDFAGASCSGVAAAFAPSERFESDFGALNVDEAEDFAAPFVDWWHDDADG